jgi:hypothetical protein
MVVECWSFISMVCAEMSSATSQVLSLSAVKVIFKIILKTLEQGRVRVQLTLHLNE